MNRFLRAAGMLLVAALVVPAFAADDPKPDDKKVDPAAKKPDDPKAEAKKDDKADPKKADKADPKKDDKADPAAKKDDKTTKTGDDKPAKKAATKKEHVVTEKTMKAGDLVGRIVSVNGTGKVLRLKVTYEVPKVNTGAVNGLAQAQQRLVEARLKRDYNGMAQAQADMARQQAQMATLERKETEVEVTAADDVSVRTKNPPEQFDEKGRLKRLTEKEKRELKGPDQKAPGFPAEFTDLRQDQVVQVTLVRNKETRPATRTKPKDVEAALASGELPKASRIVILVDPK